jgi:shikimate kinase
MVLPLPLSDRNLVLTGYTGPNQPRIGRQIAERMRLPYVSVETQIAERIGMSVDEIRQYFGETRLKSIESEIVNEASLRRSSVIHISARTLLVGDTLARLSTTGPVICLVTTLDAMLQRLHMAMGARYYNPEERALELGSLRREWAVRGLAGIYEVDTTYLDNAATMERVIDLWQSVVITGAS